MYKLLRKYYNPNGVFLYSIYDVWLDFRVNIQLFQLLNVELYLPRTEAYFKDYSFHNVDSLRQGRNQFVSHVIEIAAVNVAPWEIKFIGLKVLSLRD